MIINEISAKELIDCGKLAVEIILAFVVVKVKLEISEIKVWILENFERREK